MNSSLQMRLTVAAVASSVLILLLMGGGLYVVVARSLSRQFDHTLLVRALAAAASVDLNDRHGRLEVKVDADLAARGGTVLHTLPQWMEIWDPHQHVIYRSPALRHRNLTYLPVPDANNGPIYRRFQLADGRRGREVLLAIGTTGSDGSDLAGNVETPLPRIPLVLAVGRSTRALTAAVTLVFWSVLLACLAATVLLAATLSWITRRGLKPLETLAVRIGRVAVEDLSERVEMAFAPSEMVPVIDRLNDLLTRLEHTLAREKALTADIAHELRTPLAAMQTALELNLSRARDVEACRLTIKSTLGITRQMQNLVANLLTLARAESGTLRLAPQAVAVGSLIESMLVEYGPAFADKNVRVMTSLDAGTKVSADPAALATILHNLLDNALAYVDVGGTVEIGAQIDSGRVRLRMANTGSDIAAPDALHVFERFWRGDPSRSGGGTHCGIGLSLVQRLVQLLGGTTSVASERGGEFVIVVDLMEAACA